MKINYLIIVFAIPLLVAMMGCGKDDHCGNESPDFLVFGHFYGECAGEGCVEIFKIDQSTLYEDTLDQYPGSEDFYQGQFETKLSNAKLEMVKDLESYFPEELFSESNIIIGQPDGGDWGGLYFEIKRGSTHRFWLLDQLDSNMPAVYNEFVDRINEKIAIIQP